MATGSMESRQEPMRLRSLALTERLVLEFCPGARPSITAYTGQKGAAYLTDVSQDQAQDCGFRQASRLSAVGRSSTACV